MPKPYIYYQCQLTKFNHIVFYSLDVKHDQVMYLVRCPEICSALRKLKAIRINIQSKYLNLRLKIQQLELLQHISFYLQLRRSLNNACIVRIISCDGIKCYLEK